MFDQVEKGIEPPSDLVSACNLLGEVKNFQDECVQVVALTVYSLKFPSVKNLILIELIKKMWDKSQTQRILLKIGGLISPPPVQYRFYV